MRTRSASAASGGLAPRAPALERAVEEAVDEVAEGDEDRDDDERLRHLLRGREVGREQEDGPQHDRGEDEPALERAAPGGLLRIALHPRRAPSGGRLRLRLAVRIDLVALFVDPDVLVAVLLRPPPPLLLARHRADYAVLLQATL